MSGALLVLSLKEAAGCLVLGLDQADVEMAVFVKPMPL